jgi:hypothetical protein
VDEYRWSQITCNYKSLERILTGRRTIYRKWNLDASKGIGMLKIVVNVFLILVVNTGLNPKPFE